MTPDEFCRLAEKPFARVRSELMRNPLDVLKRQRLAARAPPIVQVVTLPMPPSNNDLVRPVRKVRLVKTKEARDWLDMATAALRRRVDLVPYSGPVQLAIVVEVGMVTADVTNRVKALEDALTGFLWHDDLQVTSVVLTKRLATSTEPRVVVTVGPDGSCPPDLADRILRSKRGKHGVVR